jgi:hypothetical protein
MDCRVYRAVRASAGVLVPELAPRERRPRVSAARAKGAQTLPGDWLLSTASPQSTSGLLTEPPTGISTASSLPVHRLAPVDKRQECTAFFTGNPAVFPESIHRSRSGLRLISHSPRVAAFGLFPAGAGPSAVPFRTEIREAASTASQQSVQGLRTERTQGYPQRCAQNTRRFGPHDLHTKSTAFSTSSSTGFPQSIPGLVNRMARGAIALDQSNGWVRLTSSG